MKIRDSLLVLCLASVTSAADGPITVFTAKKFIGTQRVTVEIQEPASM